MKSKPVFAILLILALTLVTQARHRRVDFPVATMLPATIDTKPVRTPTGWDMSPVHRLVLDI